MHPSLLRTFGYSVLSPKNSYLTSIFEKKQFFEAIFKMFGKAVFEVIEVKGGRMVKEQDFEDEKRLNEYRNYFLIELMIK